MAGVINPGPHQGLIDQVYKGVQIAKDIYGIKSQMDANDDRQQAEERAKQQYSDEQAGNFTPKEIVGLGKSYNVVDKETPNALKIGRRTGPDTVDDVYILPKKNDGSPLIHAVQNATSPEGKTGTAFFDLNQPQGSNLVNFVETAKAPPASHYISGGFDAKGTPWALDTSTGAYKQGDTGGTALVKTGRGGSLPIADGAADPKLAAKEREGLKKTFIDSGQRSNVGALKNKILTAGSLQALIDAHPDGQMSPGFQTEIAMGLSKMITGAAPTQETIQKMDPQTRGTFIANLMQKLTDEPVNANNPGFIKQFADTISRERATAENQLGDIMAQARFAAPNFYKSDPKSFFGLIGAKQEDFDTSNGDFVYVPKKLGAESPKGGSGQALAGTEKSGGAHPHPKDADALKWANEHRMSKNPDEAAMALQILQVNGK